MKITIWVEDDKIGFSKKSNTNSFESAEEDFGKLQRHYEKFAKLFEQEEESKKDEPIPF